MTNHDRIEAQFLASVAWWREQGKGGSERLQYWAKVNLTRTIGNVVIDSESLANCLYCRHAGRPDMTLENIVLAFPGTFADRPLVIAEAARRMAFHSDED